MIRFRSVLFWCHLTAGVLGGVVILVMSFTGVVLALRPQIQNWVDREVRYVTPSGAPRLGAQDLLTAVKRARPAATPQSLSLDRDPDVAATVNLGRDGNVYVNPYTGAVLGAPSARTSQFFQSMITWHRYMGTSGDYRATGRAATGASNLAFLVLGLSGLYLWWPKALTLRYVKPIIWFRRTTTGRARDFNWHNTIGFWCLPAIVIMTLSGVVLSYQWGNTLVYRLTGSPLPGGRGGGPGVAEGPGGAEGRGGRGGEPVAGRGARGGGAPGVARGGEARAARGGVAREGAPGPGNERTPLGSLEPSRPVGPVAGVPGGNGQGQSPAVIPSALDSIFARAERQVPTWSQLSLRLPNRDGGPVAFTITDGAQWNQYGRSQLVLDGTSGEVVQWQPYEAQNLGQKVRGWLRFAHTGELGGLTGQIVAGVGCLGGVMLVYTGLSLAFRRLWSWSLWGRLHASRRVSRGEDMVESTARAIGRPAATE